MNNQIIKADYGWFIVRFVSGSGDHPDYLSLDPIIAWHVETDPEVGQPISYEITPLTINGGPDSLGNPWAIKTPEGAFLVDGSLWSEPDVEADVIAKLKEDYAADLRMRAARKPSP